MKLSIRRHNRPIDPFNSFSKLANRNKITINNTTKINNIFIIKQIETHLVKTRQKIDKQTNRQGSRYVKYDYKTFTGRCRPLDSFQTNEYTTLKADRR